MIDDSGTDLLRVEVVEATPAQEPILANLLDLYVHDFSDFLDLEIGEDGRFGYPSLSSYWSEAGRHPFLIRSDRKLAGLALVKMGPEAANDDAIWDMAEFFVLRGCRGRGVGTLAACELWRLFPGPWQVRVMHRNVPARQFWARAISTFTGKAVAPRQIEKNGELWDLFLFRSRQTDAADSRAHTL